MWWAKAREEEEKPLLPLQQRPPDKKGAPQEALALFAAAESLGPTFPYPRTPSHPPSHILLTKGSLSILPWDPGTRPRGDNSWETE